MIRFDAKDEGMLRWEVSINLNPVFRGRGLGWRFLVSAVEFFSAEKDFSILFANVGESSNVASRHTFLKAGFISAPDPEYQYHYEISNTFK